MVKESATIQTSFHQNLLKNDLLWLVSGTTFIHNTLGGASSAAVLTGLLLLSSSPLEMGDTMASVGLMYLRPMWMP